MRLGKAPCAVQQGSMHSLYTEIFEREEEVDLNWHSRPTEVPEQWTGG